MDIILISNRYYIHCSKIVKHLEQSFIMHFEVHDASLTMDLLVSQ